MEVVATARDGEDGLEKALALKPDVVTLDVQMPRMDGLTMLRRLMDEQPTPVVMVSSVTQHQTPTAVEALMAGAVDIVAKPGGAISLNLADVQAELVAKVRAAAGAKVSLRRRTERRADAPSARKPSRVSVGRGTAAVRTGKPSATPAVETVNDTDGVYSLSERDARSPGPAPVVIGSSTGGPAALSTVMAALPADFSRPIVIVQHMPAGFTASLAKRLDKLSPLTVREGVEHEQPRPGQAWVAPGGVHLLFDRRGRMRFSHEKPHLGMRPAVDLTLESAVDVWGADVVAVILTGMGMDGARGARKLKRVGGLVLAQDEQSSVVYGMPRAVAEMGLADYIRPLSDIAATLQSVVAART